MAESVTKLQFTYIPESKKLWNHKGGGVKNFVILSRATKILCVDYVSGVTKCVTKK